MPDDETNHMEVNDQFFEQVKFVQSVLDYVKIDAKIYLNGPVTIPIACNEVVRAKAEQMGILTTEAGIVFIIDRMEDFVISMEKLRSLFYSASDLAGRLPKDLAKELESMEKREKKDLDKSKAMEGSGGSNGLPGWFKNLFGHFKIETK